MKKFLQAFILVFLTAGLFTDYSKKNLDELLMQAQDHVKLHEYIKAIAIYEYIVSEFPTNPKVVETLFLIAEVKEKRGDYMEAAAQFEKILLLHPNNNKKDEILYSIFKNFYNMLFKYSVIANNDAKEKDQRLIYKVLEAFDQVDWDKFPEKKTEYQKKLKKWQILLLLNKIDNALKRDEWIKLIYVAFECIDVYPDESNEAYFRLIELFVNQNNESLLKDADVLYEQMNNKETDILAKQAHDLILSAKQKLRI